MPPGLEEKEFPPEFYPAWEHFWEIKTGPAITWGELESYCKMSGEYIEPLEARLIMQLDRIRNKEVDRLQRAQNGNGKNNAPSRGKNTRR